MSIRFSQQEIEEMKNYFNQVKSGETQWQLHGLHYEAQEWTTIFLLLRKLLAYGIHNGLQTNQEITFKELQLKTQTPKDMLANVHKYVDQFEQLLDTYIANQ